jgi:hypothetical protein
MEKLRDEIMLLEKDLADKKKQLFLKRLEKIAGCSFVDSGILNLNITINQEENTWQISYVHYTKEYNINDYAYRVGTDSENEDNNVSSNGGNENNIANENNIVNNHIKKKSKIVFGKSAKYYIKGGIPLNVYRNTTGEIRITNLDYEFDLDLDEQRSLTRTYSENYNLPEWLAIAVLIYMSDNKWDDDALINHLSFI